MSVIGQNGRRYLNCAGICTINKLIDQLIGDAFKCFLDRFQRDFKMLCVSDVNITQGANIVQLLLTAPSSTFH